MSGCDTDNTASNSNAVALLSCEAMMNSALLAYNALITGSQEQKVKYRDQEVTYTAANVAMLKEHIRNLHATCGNSASTAILGLNVARRGAARTSFGYCPQISHC